MGVFLILFHIIFLNRNLYIISTLFVSKIAFSQICRSVERLKNTCESCVIIGGVFKLFHLRVYFFCIIYLVNNLKIAS